MSDDEERGALRAAVRQYLGRDPIRQDDRGQAALDRSRWTRLAGEIGVTGVRVPEELGGAGLGLAEELIVHEELGRALCDLPFLSSVGFAGAALAELEPELVADRLRALAAGSLVVACLLEPSGGTGDPVRAVADGSMVTVTGSSACVADAPGADALLVAADLDGEPVLAWVELGDDGVGVEALTALDLTRRFGRVRLDRSPATVLARGPAAASAIDAALTNGFLALAAESVGLAERALEMTVDYVKVRRQFGRPVGGFQAVKHRCADMVVELERARSAVVFATRATLGAGDADSRRAALAVARIYCGEGPFWIANETIHLHGGIGYTWEHPAHLYYRRAKSNQLWLDPHGHQRRVLGHLVGESYARAEAAQ